METITSTSNNLIKDLKKQKQKDRFLLFLDTPKLVREALESGLKPRVILIEEGKEFDFAPEGVRVSRHVLESLAEVKTPAGIIGVFEYAKRPLSAPRADFLVLDEIQDAGNVGSLLRSALGANFLDVYLLDCSSVTNDKVVRSSMSSIFKLNIFELKKEEFLSAFKSWNRKLFAADMDGENIFSASFTEPVGVVLGNEGRGVSQELKEICDKKISVPMKNNLESLNVSVAGGIIMFQISGKRL